MFNLSSLFSGGVSSASQPLIQALLAKHGGGGLPALPKVDGAPKVGPDVGPPDLTDVSARTGNVMDSLDLGNPADLGADAMSGIKSSLAANAATPRGFLDHIGDFLHSDEGRAQAMRFAAGAFKGGMAGGLDAATDFADRRHHENAAAAAAAADRDERGREFDENHQFHLGQLDATRDQNRETAEHYRRGDMNDSRRIDADLYKHDTPSGGDRLSNQTSIYKHLNPSGDARLSTSERRFEHLTPSGDTETTQAAETARNTQDNQTAITTARIGHEPPKDTIHVHYQATPETLGAKHAAAVAAVRPSQAQPTSGAPTKVASDEEYNALPSGARFIGPDGQVRIKP